MAEVKKVTPRKGEKQKEEKKAEEPMFKAWTDAVKKEVFQAQMFLKKCKKPSGREYKQLLKAHAKAVLCLGFLGYVIKFIHIPINNILFGIKTQ